jgi:hypothetical protein
MEKLTAETWRRGESKSGQHTSTVKRGRKTTPLGYSIKQATSGDLAANDSPSHCFRARLLGNNGVHHRTRNNSFDTALGRGKSAIESLNAVTEQGAHIDRAAFI